LNPALYLHDDESRNLLSARTLKDSLLRVTKALRVRDFRGFLPARQICFCCAKYPEVSFANAKVKGPAVELSLGTVVNLADRFYSDARIASLGCHIVPKSQPDDEEELSWRISFSRAEVELSKLIPPTARMCLIGLKIIAKDYLSVACSRISSYSTRSRHQQILSSFLDSRNQSFC